jgi:hypothetical protein
MASRLILVALVVLALGGLYGVAGLSRPLALTTSAPTGPIGHLPVTSALLACPAPGSAGIKGGGVAIANAPASTGSGHLDLTALNASAGPPGPAPVTISPAPGQLTIKAIKNAPAVTKKVAAEHTMAAGVVPTSMARGGLIISAAGSDAQGLDVEQLGPAGQPTGRCQAPGSDFWFVGPGSTSLHTELYLINPDSQPADANLSVQTESGPQIGIADSGINVPPHGMVVQSLTKLLHAAKAIALHVTTSTGRVLAAVRETTSFSKPGIWLPSAEEPATTQVLTGLPGTGGARELYITVPGDRAAKVKVTAVTPRGSYQPTGGNGISLLGHLTAGVSIPSLSGSPGSIVVTSNVPVTAELEITGGPSGAPGAFLTGSGPISEQGVVAASPGGPAGVTSLVLSDPGKRSATVKVAVAVPGSPLTGQAGQTVTVSAKSATEVRVALPKTASRRDKRAPVFAIIVTPLAGSGQVYGARLAESGHNVVGILPVESSPTRIELPYVRASLVNVLG